MANNIKSVNFLPEYLRTDKNSKFLSATLDQWIQPAQIDRISGYIGSKNTPTYVSTSDVYIPESLPLRRDYQLTPALVVNNSLYEVQDVIALDDLINEINLKGGNTKNLDRLLRSDFYSYNPFIDWDKLINYQEYYWLVEGPNEIEVTEDIIDINQRILGKQTYNLLELGINLTNGLKLRFINEAAGIYYDKDYFVEGVGSDQGIRLIAFENLITPEPIANLFNDEFGLNDYDYYKFDNTQRLPLIPEYITINRSSQDINSWSRYNRWVHADVIRITAESNGQLPVYPVKYRAQRPIIEFTADLKLYNHGTYGIPNVDFIDNTIVDPTEINNTYGFYVDQTLLEKGNRIIFNASAHPEVIYQVNFNQTTNKFSIVESSTAEFGASVTIDHGVINHGTEWYFDGSIWNLAQQHTSINQAPLFDLFDTNGVSYSDNVNLPSNFKGCKIFGYTIGTGTSDKYLGFPLKYRNSVEQGDYLFSNYFMTDNISIITGAQFVTVIPTSSTYLKFRSNDLEKYVNVWTITPEYHVPVLQFQTTQVSTSSIEVVAIDSPTTTNFEYDVYLDTRKLLDSDTYASTSMGSYIINFNNTLPADSNVLIKLYTDSSANSSGYYETPLGLTNNPLNGAISEFTLSELSDHLGTMVVRSSEFVGKFPGISNLRDLPNIGQYGTRLIANANPIAFANMFIGKKEHSVVDAITKVANQYNHFKNQLVSQMNRMVDQQDPIGMLDEILSTINQDKTLESSYRLSDMLGYGTYKTVNTYNISFNHYVGQEPAQYPISSTFSTSKLSLRSILVYLNGVQLILHQDYEFIDNDSYVGIITGLLEDDVLTIVEYPDTSGSYIPPTPSKLGLYPAFYPKIYVDNSYITPQTVILGHDGSTTIAYGDFRDDVLLEFEKRVYNNIKEQYRIDLFDINSVMPGAFRSNQYSLDEINAILEADFVKWAGFNGVDYTTNNIFDDQNSLTWNYLGGYIPQLDLSVSGNWRAVYKYLYDTDRPHSHPWEILGFTEEPDWWEEEYGNDNDRLWLDIQSGLIKRGDRAGLHPIYARPSIIDLGLVPVDLDNNLIDPAVIVKNITIYNRRQSWKFGDQAPAETAWRRSSYWPFAVQRLLALTKPATYTSIMYDLSRVDINIAGQWASGPLYKPFSFLTTEIYNENSTLTSGYSVWVSEIGSQRTQNYITELRNDLSYANFNLFYKVGGFVSKDKLQITIDAYEPTSNAPGALLPQEDYTLRLNVSNPIKSASISGIIVQKSPNGSFVIKGYDTQTPHFTVYTPVRTNVTPAVTVGGISESYITWTSNTGVGNSGLTSVDTTSASAATGLFYQEGQVVAYGGSYYRVKTSHRGEDVFNPIFYQRLPRLPESGGASAQTANSFNNVEIKIPYGMEFNSIQEVYDVIIGYGAWLKDQGFIFDEYNNDIQAVINWEFSGKEFLYWTTQNWATNNVITLSPFADQIKYSYNESIVENLFDTFYEYSLLLANGLPFPRNSLFISRQDGVCTISSNTPDNGIYFARLNSVQKEHSIVFSNKTIFNDIIYDIETGYQQQRMKVSGFRTKDWNGDLSSPGFVYDDIHITNWKRNTAYQTSSVVQYNGFYYSAKTNIEPSLTFDIKNWITLDSKPVGGLLPNFDYRINQFQDFYSLDIDNFDAGQEKMAQHLIGYTPRVYLNNIFTDPIAQYKFYQGFIREKGTRNAIQKLSKATIQNFQGTIDFTEEWAFRIGEYGSFSTYKELENTLVEGTFFENPQIIQYVNNRPDINDLIYYSTASNRSIIPDNYNPKTTFYTTTGTYNTNSYILPTAGYVRLDDVKFTAYNETSLISTLSTSSISSGDTVWLGFKQNGTWDVLRYALTKVNVIDAFISVSGQEIIFTTDEPHRLSSGDLISISQYTTQLNGMYSISSIVAKDQFSVASSLLLIDATVIQGPGQLFKFVSSRANTFDTLPADTELVQAPTNTLYWVNSDEENSLGKWTVYNKTQNYYPIDITSGILGYNEEFGSSISQVGSDNLFMVGSPGCSNPVSGFLGYGKVTAYVKVNGESIPRFRYFLNQDENRSYFTKTSSNNPEFGSAVIYDDQIFPGTNGGLIFAGAPKTSYVKMVSAGQSINTATTRAFPTELVEQGLVTISSIDPTNNEEIRLLTLASPYPENYEKFGSELYVQKHVDSKLLLIGAPGRINGSNLGKVYAYQIGHITSGTTTTLTISYISSLTQSIIGTAGMKWGHSISGSDDATVIAIGAPGFNNRTGMVEIFSGTQSIQVIESPFPAGGEFGSKVEVSSDGSYLIVSAPDVYDYSDNNKAYGQVVIYQNENGIFNTSTIQILDNPLTSSEMKFGHDISINSTTNILAISSLGTDFIDTSFDENQTRNIGGRDVISTISTLNDLGTTKFYTKVERTGTVYVYNRLHNRFVFSEELEPRTSYEGADHGYTVKIDKDDTIFVGAPAIHNQSIGSFLYQYNSTSTTSLSWSSYRVQEDLVNIDTVQRAVLIDVYTEEILNYLETIDPAKGKISGVADRELKYRSMFDPAVYTIGAEGTVVNENINWIDNHIGELWWDLSTVKYQWYEQGDLEYRKNNWGRVFPGSNIDVYEWVGSSLLPSEWVTQADTEAGLTIGISGQPKFLDDSTVSVKQIYNSITGTFTNYYYYWVKNKVIVPNISGRKVSSFEVARIINDPVAYGIQFIAPISSDALILSNISSIPVGERINLNIAMDLNPNNIPKHTEWLLLQENNSTSLPNVLLEKKLIDSLIGHDSLGNLVPDANLNPRQAYGVSIRPRQSMFKDRFQALRNLLDFTNSILINVPLTGNYSFVNLNSQENIPNEYTHEWDQIIETLSDRDNIDIRSFTPATSAVLTAVIYNGRITEITIDNPGFGYLISPTVTVIGNGTTTAVITTEINNLGEIISTNIVNAGDGYYDTPELSVRPYTVIVRSDAGTGNRWAKHVWDAFNKRWSRVHTQKYDTTRYWSYVNYLSADYNKFKIVDYTIDSTYELDTIIGETSGDYILIKNIGDNRSAIVTPTSSEYGTFSKNYDLLWSENGTIQLSNDLWDIPDSQLGFDEANNFDTTLYNQAPDLELGYILSALKNDIFIDDLKINWNLFFFKAVKYALYEQKLLDWAFKTTFINVTNYAGKLDQRPVYKIATSSYFEKYIEEVKPYHTQIRNFTTNQTVLDPISAYNTDFDLPSYYNTTNKQFENVDINNSLIDEYPWKSWGDNYDYSLKNIVITNPGTLYTEAPTVVISSPDLTSGSTATAQAFIGGRKLYFVKLLNAGSGYTKTPTVNIVGGTTGTIATVYAELGNDKVRKNTIDIKFDRISSVNQVGNLNVTNSFICDGSSNEFVLSWVAQADKQTIDVTLDNDLVLISDYTIKYYTDLYNGYNKKYSKLVFLNYVPKLNQIVKISYKKNIGLLSAIERLDYFTSITDYTTVTSGLVYPGTTLQSAMFDHTSAWTEPYLNYDEFAWNDAVNNYTTAISVGTSDSDNDNTYVQLNSVENIQLYQYANVISVTTPTFNTATVVVINIDTATKIITLNCPVIPSYDIPNRSTIEFWNNNTDFSILDIGVQGGAWTETTSLTDPDYIYYTNLFGIDPSVDIAEDSTGNHFYIGGVDTSNISIDGDGYYTENTGFTPEELISGQSTDSVGINVYTKDRAGSPTVFVSNFSIFSGSTSTIELAVLPPNSASISVVVNFDNSFQDILFEYIDSTSWTSPYQFTINWEESALILPPQVVGGVVGYTILLVDGNGFVDYSKLSTTGTDQIQLRSLGNFDTIFKSSYVTVDGVAISTSTSTSEAYYVMDYADSEGDIQNRRAAVNIYNVSTGSHLAQAWFFNSEYKQFNEVKEQFFFYYGTQVSFEMLYPPKNFGPVEGSMIVEYSNSQGTRRLRPPNMAYYEYVSDISIISSNENYVTYPIPTNGDAYEIGSFTNLTVKVYRNGNELSYGYDFTIMDDPFNPTITIIPHVLFTGDVISIVNYARNGGFRDYDFRVDGNVLVLRSTDDASLISPEDFSNGGFGQIKVITFNNHDTLLMQTENFDGVGSGLYQISRPALNSNYVWVSVDGYFLINRIDFTILDDQRTIQLADQFTGSQIKEVIVTSLNASADPILGYRIFTDMFNRTEFKRLSKRNTTYLTEPLYVHDIEIHVKDSSVLSKPLVSKKIPGVVIIDGERIEYFRINGNVLSQLRRGTLGTAPSNYSQIYTKVIDQGPAQTVPYSENTYRQTYINIGTTNTYIITTTNTTTYYDTMIVELSSGTGATIYSATPYDNLVEVYNQVNYGFDSLDIVPYEALDGTIQIDIPPQPTDTSYVVQSWFIGQGDPGAQVPYMFRNDGITLYSDTINVTTSTVYINGSLLNTTSTFTLPSIPTDLDHILVEYTTGTFTWIENSQYPIIHYPITSATTSSLEFIVGNDITSDHTNTIVLRNGHKLAPYYDYLITVYNEGELGSTSTVTIIPNVLMAGDNIDIIYHTGTSVASEIPEFVVALTEPSVTFYNDENFTYRVEGSTATIGVISATSVVSNFIYIAGTNWNTSTNSTEFTIDEINNLIIPPQSYIGALKYTVNFYGTYVEPANQVSVYYGGRPLRKTGIFRQNTNIAYDSPIVPTTIDTVETTLDLPITKIVNTAYVTSDTNQVWVYTDSNDLNSINGYVYQGFDYLPPEFTINPTTQQLTLNIPEALKSHLPVRVDIVKREYAAITEWNNLDPMNVGKTLSLMKSTSTQARFLQNRPAELPDSYYYGGDRDLLDISGFALTLPDGNPLEEN